MRKINSRPSKGRPALPADERKSIVVTAKFSIDEYQLMMDKALTSGLKKSEYLRHSALHCKVVERLKPKDVKYHPRLAGYSRKSEQDCQILCRDPQGWRAE